MNPIDFPQAFRTLGAPAGSENVTPLRIWTNGQEVISFWLPTEAERAKIAAGEPIILRLQSGATMHPACIEVGSPFEEPDAISDVDWTVLRDAGIAIKAPRMAPWPDFGGSPIFEGDVIRHPDGTEGTVVWVEGGEPSDQWRVDYGDRDGILHRLCLQIGDKGMAKVAR